MGQFIVSARKYRPQSFETLLGQENIARTLKNSIERGQLAHAYLFCGPRGVGKTTAARIFAKTINCSSPGENMEPCGECESCRSFAENRSYCIHELDAASNNSVEDIRTLTEQVRIPPQVGRYSVFIIDEVHMLSQAAFNAFLKTLEEPPAHAIFILATTEKHKILPTILSRCQTYDFNRIGVEDMVKNIKGIAEAEGVTISEDAMHVIAQKADGAMRDALTMFDQMVAFCGKEITYGQVIKNLNVLDYDYYFSLTDSFLGGDYPKAILTFDEILSKGFNAQGFIGGLSSHFRDLLVCKNGASQTLIELAPKVCGQYKDYAAKCSVNFLFQALEISANCEAAYKQSGNPRLLIEFALMKICSLAGLVGADKPSKAEKPAPVQTPAPAPAPQSETRKTSGLSIKELLKEESGKPAAAEPSQKAEEHTELTAEMLEPVWKALAESESAMPRLSAAISGARPEIDGQNRTVAFKVGNVAQMEWIRKNCLSRMEAFIQKALKDASVRLEVAVKEAQEVDKTVYMPRDKAKYLNENSEAFRKLSEDLNLEIS